MEKFERRDIIKMASGAIVGGSVGALFSGAPFLGLQWLVEWTQDQYVPGAGETRYVSGVCQACPNKCAISVRMIGQRAVKVETANSGCATAQAIVQLLYHPDRIRQPLKRVGKKGSGKFAPVSYEEALKDIAAKINELRDSGTPQTIAAINGPNADISSQLLERLVKASGSANFYYEPSFDTLSAAAVGLTQNQAGSIHYDFENSDYILSFSARLLEGWGEAGRMHKVFAGWKDRGARYVQIDALANRSASAADMWVPVNAGTEAVLAMGIAYYLITAYGKRSGGANFAQWSQMIIKDYTPDAVSEITGVAPEKIKEIAREFAYAKAPVAVAGKGAKGVSSSTVEIAAVQALNSLVGAFGRRGGVFIKSTRTLGAPALDAIAAAGIKNSKKAAGIDAYIKNGDAAELLFLNEANPVLRSVYGKDAADKLAKIPMVVAFAVVPNDTTKYADYILPSVSTLEMASAKGDEAVAPRYKAMYAGDSILMIAKAVKGVQNAFPWNGYRELIAATGQADIRAAANFSFPMDLFSNYLTELTKKMSAADYPLALIPFELPLVGDGSGLALPYTLKGLDDTTLTGKKLWVLLNPDTADKYGVSEGESIDIESKRGEVGSVKAHLTKTVAPDVVAVPIGFGQKSSTMYAEGKGINPKEIMSDDIDPISGVADWWCTRVKIS